MKQKPEVISLPVLINLLPASKPQIIHQAPTLLAIDDDYLEINMYYEFSHEPPEELAPEDAWKRDLGTNEKKRISQKVYCHFFAKRKELDWIQMGYENASALYYIEFSPAMSPLIYIEREEGVELLKKLIDWWKKE